jgi:hypothetical protein
MGGGGMGGMEEMMAGMNIPRTHGSMRTPWNAVLNTRLFPDGLNLNWTKRKSAEVESIENGYSIEKTSDKNDFVFKLNKDEAQPKTSLKQPAAAAAPKEEAWLEELIADQSSIVGNTAQKPKAKKEEEQEQEIIADRKQTIFIYRYIYIQPRLNRTNGIVHIVHKYPRVYHRSGSRSFFVYLGNNGDERKITVYPTKT